LLREAVFLKGGIPAISEFARTYATQFPIAYIDWIHALEREGDKDAALQAAAEGLSNIPGDYVTRADVAEKLSMIGIVRQDNLLKLKGFKERFYSNPTLDHLLDLYITAGEVGCFEETKEEAEKRLTELREKGETAVHTYVEIERRHAQVYEGDFIHALLLNGHHEDVFQMCKGKGVLGWSSSAHPKPVMLTFLMDLLSGEKKYTDMLNKQWEYAVTRMSYGHRDIMMKNYNKIMKDVLSTVRLTEEQDKRYLEWCKNETGKRVDAIISNKYRGSYDKAANILVAMGESLANRGNKQDGLRFVEKYQSKYSRFSAFRKEVARALKVSGCKGQRDKSLRWDEELRTAVPGSLSRLVNCLGQ